ncbi:hypothetical protein VTI74DRAFT_7023 [Chaetomium olivicolor]
MELILASFYSWNAGTTMQKSHVGLMRSLLRQCLLQQPGLTLRVCKRRAACLQMLGPEALNELPDWEWDELRGCLGAFAADVRSDHRLALFIDGLDEFSEDHGKLVELIKELGSFGGVKICVSSRPWNIFNDAFNCNPSVAVQDLTRRDIDIYIKAHFNPLPAFRDIRRLNPGQVTALLKEIASKASGVFLMGCRRRTASHR